MSKNAIKVVTTKLGKKLSGYLFLKYDMEFAARAFALAAMRGVRSVPERLTGRPSVEDRTRLWQAMDPILRAGAAIAQIDEDDRSESEAERSALFEAGIVTYGRCFNSGLRTRLSKDIFIGDLSRHRKLHDAIIRVRNKHIAHSELKMEQSIVGIQLVDDQDYGKRPNLVLTMLIIRRHFPADVRLAELESHCRTIVEKVIEPRILVIGRSLREQLLQMPAEQIEGFPDFGATKPTLEELL